MAPEVRSEHHRDLERLDIALGGLLAVIPDAVDHATASLLSGDVALRAEVDRWAEMVVAISDDVDETAEVIIARQAPMAGELRFVMTCVRLVLRLAETIDLVADIGGSAALSPEGSVPARVQPMLAAIGHDVSAAWSEVSDRWHEGQPDGQGQSAGQGSRRQAEKATLRLHEDHVAETRTSLVAELAAAGTDTVAAAELGSVLYGYDRIVRHADAVSSLIEGLPHPGGYRQRDPEPDGAEQAGGDGQTGPDGDDGSGGPR